MRIDVRNQVKRVLRMCGEAFSSSVNERLDAIEAQWKAADLAETQAALLRAAIHTAETLEQTQNYALVETRDPKLASPELGLMDFLYSYLPARTAILIGGGEISEALVDTGYEVYSASCAKDLPEAVRAGAGLIRIGAAMCDASPQLEGPVVVRVFAETIEPMVSEMRARGYAWHIVLYRVPGSDRVRFYANHRWTAPESRGEAFFFRDYSVFAQAQLWCSAVLPRTYFQPARPVE